MKHSPYRITLATFWQHVDANDASGCWPWLGRMGGGYGYVALAGQQLRAHRVAYELAGHSIPAGYDVHHTCQNKRCCRPAHLQAVTSAQHGAAHRKVWAWRFILRRPATQAQQGAHFGVVGFGGMLDAYRGALRWQRYYPDHSEIDVQRYAVPQTMLIAPEVFPLRKKYGKRAAAERKAS
jgi:hypothetical protein